MKTSETEEQDLFFTDVNDFRNWYALYAKPRAEKKLRDRLEEKGVITYLPLQKQLRQWSDRKKWVEEPIFRGYIFVKASEKDFQSILSTPGTVNFVRFGGKPATVDARASLKPCTASSTLPIIMMWMISTLPKERESASISDR
jgi:hypothetical protein